jgi:osmotically inducible protein OsmC
MLEGAMAMSDLTKLLYTAEASAEGGRDGHAHTNDGRLDVELDVPAEMGGSGGAGTNPEQLFAAGWAACFQTVLIAIASGRELDLTGSRVTARVGLGPKSGGGFGLTAALDLDAPAIDRAESAELMERTHELCPYSRATRGNIEVNLTVAGEQLEVPAAR